jgi:creatinine amidohydrolase
MRLAVLGLLLLVSTPAAAQDLPTRWDELTASDWPKALEKSHQTAVLPIGILEKHGPHAPIGSDLIQSRDLVARAVKQEYAVVFPDYFYGQIYEARHEPGTFALPVRLIWDLLDATCAEIARNGFKKILIVNSHGGNPNFLRFFVQAQLEHQRDYVVYLHEPGGDQAFASEVARVRKSDPSSDMHAGETETATLLALRPDLVHLDRATSESGADQHRLQLPDLYTAIWWYARFPNHYAGNGAVATPELGRLLVEHRVAAIVKAIGTVKADTTTGQVQQEFFEKVLK